MGIKENINPEFGILVEKNSTLEFERSIRMFINKSNNFDSFEISKFNRNIYSDISVGKLYYNVMRSLKH